MNKGGQIIFVDDDEEDHLIIFEYFKDFGKDKQIKFIRNGMEALQYLAEIAETDPLPKLIVLDLNMPILNGTQTLLQIKRNKRYKDIPVLIFSTSENENEKRKCLSLGADEYLVKPTTYLDGLKMVERFTRYIE
jgi:CheY-like chemotaxis protein